MIKEKAKDHSVYQKTIVHHHLIAAQKAPRPISKPMKVIVFCVVTLIIAIIIIGLVCES